MGESISYWHVVLLILGLVLLLRNRDSKTQQENRIDELDDQNPFDRIELSIHEEENWKKRFDLTMDPREWVARNGHTYISGDWRFFKYRDEELKN